MLQKMSFLQKLKRWGAREEKELCSAGEGSSSTSVLLPSECSTPSGRNPSGCPTHSGCFETALSHEVLFKMMVMVLLLCVTIDPAMAADSLGAVLNNSTGYASIFAKTLIIGGTGLGAVACLRQGNMLMALGVVVSGDLIGMMLSSFEGDGYKDLLGMQGGH